jgi:hypothetical protein
MNQAIRRCQPKMRGIPSFLGTIRFSAWLGGLEPARRRSDEAENRQ